MPESLQLPLRDPVALWLVSLILGGCVTAVAIPFASVCLKGVDAPSRSDAVKWGLFGGVIATLFVLLACSVRCLSTPEVQPAGMHEHLRILFQLGLIVLLVGITATDWKTCYIPLVAPIVGLFVAPLLAFWSGDLQICHVWVDWRAEVPQLSGPYLPGWLSSHPHLHGLAWSLTGAAAGTVMTWIVRKLSGWALGMPALGEGDVWLMAMIGAFLGWQPTVIAFAIAPLAAILVGLPVRVLSSRPYVPYGPFLAFGAVTVLLAWRWIWMFETGLGTSIRTGDHMTRFRLRDVFGDPGLMAGLAGVMMVALVVMLGWRRWVSRPGN